MSVSAEQRSANFDPKERVELRSTGRTRASVPTWFDYVVRGGAKHPHIDFAIDYFIFLA